ncbi:MAG: molybdopterin-dependent oxidoreductase, partial [Candidatus Latescibacteria bacterium]|nr:molybdopterin-dependent oxidoreductase [Candidatus Latescibacterota bacterium]
MKVNRREFLTFAGFTVAGVTLGRLGRDRILAHETFKESWGDGPGVEQWVRSVCGQCPAGCGLNVRVVDGHAVKIEGNELCPVSRGGLCPKGAAGLQALYDPDRLVGPVQRLGPRGSGRWKRIGWEEALRIVATRLGALRQQGQPQSVVWLTGRQSGMIGQLLRRFCEAYGTPNFLEIPDLYDETSTLVAWATHGIAAPLGYDLEHTAYLLSFGSPILESWRSPVWANRAYGRLRRGRPDRRGRFIQVESRLSPTAAKADEWIPINPGTEAALALGIAHV